MKNITFPEYFLNARNNINHKLIMDFPMLSFMKLTLFFTFGG